MCVGHSPRHMAEVAQHVQGAPSLAQQVLSAACQGQHQLLASLLQQLQHSTAGSHDDSVSNSCATPSEQLEDVLLARDAKGMSPLMWAAYGDHPDCITVLLGASMQHAAAQVTAVDVFGGTAAMYAAAAGATRCLEQLLSVNPDAATTATDDRGINALMYALMSRSTSCVQKLLEAACPEAQISAVDTNGRSALMWAALTGDAESAQLILMHSPGKQLATVDAAGMPALSWAAAAGRPSCMRLLLQHRPPQLHMDQALLHAVRSGLEPPELSLEDLPPEAPGAGTRRRSLSADRGAPVEGLSASKRRCVELLLAQGARLPAHACDSDSAVVWRVVQHMAALALVPDMANEAVVGLALEVCRNKKVAALQRCL